MNTTKDAEEGVAVSCLGALCEDGRAATPRTGGVVSSTRRCRPTCERNAQAKGEDAGVDGARNDAIPSFDLAGAAVLPDLDDITFAL